VQAAAPVDYTAVDTPASAQATVELRNVVKSFVDRKRGRETVALSDVSMTIGKSEFACILGPSGCGKSTILNLVAGFEQPNSGAVLIDGRPIAAPDRSRGMVFQQPLLFPWLNVIDNITFGPRMAGAPPAQYAAQAARYVQLMGLTGFEKHYPYELSGGMQQRVALARAWISEPELFLMDEPFGALDAQTRLMMQELLLRVWERSRTTVLFVTHDIDEALFLADRIFIMTARPGRIKESLAVDFVRPRNYETIIFEQQYITLKQRILQVIRGETLQAMKLEVEVE
jgi:NitT/TauT family transport system ATP-binding protein